MTLTGKCEKDFTEFVHENYNTLIVNGFGDKVTTGTIALWDKTPVSMQWGVIQEFADSKGYHITTYQMDYQNWFGYKITAIFILSEIIEQGLYRRKECMEQAIKHFNKIYNTQ